MRFMTMVKSAESSGPPPKELEGEAEIRQIFDAADFAPEAAKR
jgi:hypothetical protein